MEVINEYRAQCTTRTQAIREISGILLESDLFNPQNDSSLDENFNSYLQLLNAQDPSRDPGAKVGKEGRQKQQQAPDLLEQEEEDAHPLGTPWAGSENDDREPEPKW
ncbi:hypothetical protein SCP_0704630 [Sparassis crispa]|uniref:Uncharacterized protein n=1 Tax=Sparassis crispa TaxID=139825 RepID=A0A401GST9_9APHY|nr:hypothetical protein SCP_0704630 [Sparassis crispa]GBE85276.1 hypothetical protein SCP_0704630 [Sparassis crispa]